MALTTTGAPFSLNVPGLSSDLADLFGSYLVPNMSAINTYAAHKSTAQTFTALQTFSSGLNVTSGNVGIGTTSPVAELHVKSSGYGGIFIERRSDAGNISGALWFETSTSGNPYIRADAGDLAIFTGATINVNSGTERLRLTAAGNVGIGTTSPAQRLEVKYDAAYILVNSSNGAYSGGYYISSNSVEKWHITNEPGAAHGLYIRDAANDTGVALGQDSTAWVTASDVRLKDVQGPIINALDIVSQLTGVKFTWKRDAEKPNAKTRVGLLAQDVQAAFPEAVDDDHPDIVTDAETGKLSGGIGVRYTELVPLLVNAIKELAQRVEVLER